MSTDIRFMETYLEQALQVLDNAKHIPKGFFKESKGVMLISACEGGFLVSATNGTGVLVPQPQARWNVGNALGDSSQCVWAWRHVWIRQSRHCRNHESLCHEPTAGRSRRNQTWIGCRIHVWYVLSSTRLLSSSWATANDVTIVSILIGKVGGAVGVDAAISNKGGLGTSFIFTFSKGLLMNVEVSDAMIQAAADVNANTYGGNVDCEAIVKGKVPMPGGKQGEMIQELHDKLAAHTTGE